MGTVADRMGMLAELEAKIRGAVDLDDHDLRLQGIGLVKEAMNVLTEIRPATEQTAKIAVLLMYAVMLLGGHDLVVMMIEAMDKAKNTTDGACEATEEEGR